MNIYVFHLFFLFELFNCSIYISPPILWTTLSQFFKYFFVCWLHIYTVIITIHRQTEKTYTLGSVHQIFTFLIIIIIFYWPAPNMIFFSFLSGCCSFVHFWSGSFIHSFIHSWLSSHNFNGFFSLFKYTLFFSNVDRPGKKTYSGCFFSI